MKPLLLAIDTTHEFGSLALLRGAETIEEIALHAPDGFAHVLYEHLARLLEQNKIQLDAVDCFASASGPGSFTGVRVGLACIKGLAEACGKPAIAVSNLQAIASFGAGSRRAALLDARRGEVYGGLYDAAGQLLAGEVVAKLPQLLETLPEEEIEFVSTDFTPFEAALSESRWTHARRVSAPKALAAALGRIACGRFMGGETPDPATLDANYVRRSDAELYWKE